MSIAKMKKVTIIGTKDKEEEILREIMKKGFLQIEDMSPLVDEEEYKGIFNKEEKNDEIAKINQRLIEIEKAISSVKKYNKIKKSMFEGKEKYVELSEKEAESLFCDAKKINEISQTIEKNNEEIQNLENLKQELEPWKGFSILDNLKNINYIKVILGTIDLKYKKEQIQMVLDKEKLDYSITIVNKDKNKMYVAFVTKNENLAQLKRNLKQFNFAEKEIKIQNETIEQDIEKLIVKITLLKKEIEKISIEIKPEKLKVFENLYDYYLSQKDLKLIQRRVVTTQNTFYLEGWMPEGCVLKNNNEYIIKVRDEQENEDVPIFVQNNNIVQPFQSITNMYSVPNKKELDPNPVMAFFYILFFGLMLSDAGYGLLLTLGCFFVIKKKKYAKGEGNLIKLLAYSGISATIWGLFFGSFFGNLLPLKAVIDPLTDVMPLMGLSLLLGIIHIYMGMFMKAVMLIKDKKIFDAICDILFWYLLLTGVFLLVVPIVAGDIGIWSQIGKYLAIAGLIGVLLTGGRKEKNIIKKFTKGLSSLYGITSYFSDVLSYSRLMALCLSTGVIAQVVNLLGAMVGPIPAVIVGIIGHGFNLANSALGSYVHTSRLQYVEFFGKFYEGGGKEFKPFKYNNKYTSIKEEF